MDIKLPAALVTSGPGFGSLTGTPIVTNGVVYLQDLGDNVYALALATGQLKWEYQVSAKIVEAGPNGVAVAGGVVYGTTMTTVFALSATTGKTIWVDQNLLNSSQGGFGIQPQVATGRVYLASSIGTGPGGGVLMALNASTGKLVWEVNTILPASSSSATSTYRTGGAWETPLVGSDGSVTFGIGNPYQTAAAAIAHPSAQLYSDSEVNLDAATGQLRWYYALHASASPAGAQARPAAPAGGLQPGQPGGMRQQFGNAVIARNRDDGPDLAAWQRKPLPRPVCCWAARHGTHNPIFPCSGTSRALCPAGRPLRAAGEGRPGLPVPDTTNANDRCGTA